MVSGHDRQAVVARVNKVMNLLPVPSAYHLHVVLFSLLLGTVGWALCLVRYIIVSDATSQLPLCFSSSVGAIRNCLTI